VFTRIAKDGLGEKLKKSQFAVVSLMLYQGKRSSFGTCRFVKPIKQNAWVASFLSLDRILLEIDI
jgi:hypothetical protein